MSLRRILAMTVTLGVAVLITAYVTGSRPPLTSRLPADPLSNTLTAGRREVRLYFPEAAGRDDGLCPPIRSVLREIKDLPTAPKTALDMLIAGPAPEERQGGLTTFIDAGVKLNGLIIDAGDANVDLDRAPAQGTGNACRESVLREQIISTLLQFPAINNVLISVNGNPSLQP